ANYYEGSYVPRSDFTREYLGREVGNVFTEFHGFYEMLLRNHIPFDVIDDVYLEKEDLQRYRLIVLPNTACMSPKTARRLKDYAGKGGNLICTFETSLYDEHGAKSKNRVFGPMNHDYLTPVTNHPILKDIPKWIPAPKYGIETELRKAIPLMLYSKRLTGRYDAVPSPSPDMALAVNAYGAGKAVFFAGTFADSYAAFHFNDYLELTGNIVRELASPPISLENAPTSLEVTLRSQAEGRRRIVHLVNFTGEMTRPMRRVIPIKDVKITLKGTRGVQSVRSLRGRRELEFKSEKSAVTFTVPRVDEYEAVVVSLED
ncbi:MAG: beta-galactosidase trimerization domain-containing protein, partial [Candidatus Bathyarchaeia archaeon]